MKNLIFINGSIQVILSSIVIFVISYFAFSISATPSLIIALSFSLSSTAVVLPYLKRSKDIVTPYGEKSVAILVFQDLAVIPILLLMSFLSNNELSLTDVLLKTFLYASIIIAFMFTLGKIIISWLLHFSYGAKMEELFLCSVFTIVLGASLFADEMGFTYSLGAFIAGMIIAETDFHVKVESAISSYKDMLLGAFFFSIGTKIDVFYFAIHLYQVVAVLVLVFVIKAITIYAIIRWKSNKSDSIKAAIALCQIGEFSFAIFALAINQNILEHELANFLILITVLSMIITPFMVNNIYRIASKFAEDYFEVDKIDPIDSKNHTIVCGFSILGRIVAKELKQKDANFLIISNNLHHVLIARKRGYQAYFGNLDKLPVLDSLKVKDSKNIIVTLNQLKDKLIICESVLEYFPEAQLVVKINSLKEKTALSGLNIKSYVHAQHETAVLLVKSSLL